MADTDEFDKGTLRNATRGIPGIGTTNERDAAGAAKDAISEGRRLVGEQHLGEKARGAEAFVAEKVHDAQAKVQDWKAEREEKSTSDREKRKEAAREKTEKYRDELETKRAEAEVKVLEAQARSYSPQGDKVTQLRDAMLNMKAEGRKMFSGPVSESMWNSRSPLEGQQAAPPLMMTIMAPGRPTVARGRGNPQPTSPLMRNTPRGRAPAMPSLLRQINAPRRKGRAGGLKGGFGGGSLIGSMFGRPTRPSKRARRRR